MEQTHRFTVDPGDDARLDTLVARRLDISRTQAATLIAGGHVRVDGRAERASFHPDAGCEVEVVVPARAARRVEPEQIPLTVVHEDEDILVVDKPAGMVVHPAPGNWTGTLVNALKGRGQPLAAGGGDERAGLVHRLDKHTSGLLVIAKTDRAHRILAKAIAERRVARRYAALCRGHLDADRVTVDRPIARNPRDRRKMAASPEALGARAARTDFVRLARFAPGDLLRAHLHTGRTHQIRVHLASIGHPVAGDESYGGGDARNLVRLPKERHFLHAAWLVFRHPVSGAVMDFRSPLPADLRTWLEAVAGQSSPVAELIAHPDPLEYLGFYRVDD